MTFLDEIPPTTICEALAPVLLPERRQRIDQLVEARLGGLRLVIENLHDPHNGAAVLRSAEAFGLQFVHVIEATERFRASGAITQGCDRWLDVIRHATTAEAVTHLRTTGFRLIAALPDAGTDIDDVDFAIPSAILVGNEHAGLSPAARAGVDLAVAIPMSGMTRSLNLSVAAAILARNAAAARRRVLARPGDLDEWQKLRLRARFYADDVRGAEGIVRRHVAAPRPES